VLLVHGLAAPRSALWLLAYRLRRQGFRTKIFGYPSIVSGVRQHAERFDRYLQEFESRIAPEPFHLVVHSMGGILVRALMERRKPAGLHRIVMLGTPNQGSHAARRLAPWLGPICPPLRELSDAPDALVRSLPTIEDYECGVIAGTRDRVVSVEATRLDRLRPHRTVRSGHGELLFRRDVAEAVSRFLKQGHFAAAAPESTFGDKELKARNSVGGIATR